MTLLARLPPALGELSVTFLLICSVRFLVVRSSSFSDKFPVKCLVSSSRTCSVKFLVAFSVTFTDKASVRFHVTSLRTFLVRAFYRFSVRLFERFSAKLSVRLLV